LRDAETWTPPALPTKALRGGIKSLQLAAAAAMQAQVNTLLVGLEVGVVATLEGEAGKQPVDIESGVALAEELEKALLLGLVGDARLLVFKQGEQLITEAAKGVAFAAERRAGLAMKTKATELTPLMASAGMQADANPAEELEPADADEASAAKQWPGAKEPAANAGNREVVTQDVKTRFLQVLQALRNLLDGSLDNKIGGRLHQLGSSLLDQHHEGVTQLGELREKGAELEKKIKEKLGGSEAAEGDIAKYLPEGGLGAQLCKDRIKRALSGITSYSKAGCCQTLRRVVMTNRDELTTHENELAYLQVTLHELAQNPPTATNWLDFSEGFQAMLQARCIICHCIPYPYVVCFGLYSY
jgi:hypothetical protein